MFEKHDQVEFELFGVGNSVFRTKYFENAIEEIKAWNTRPASPRFTAGEREAITLVGDTCDAYLHNYRFGTAEYVKLYEAIATVRKILEGKAE